MLPIHTYVCMDVCMYVYHVLGIINVQYFLRFRFLFSSLYIHNFCAGLKVGNILWMVLITKSNTQQTSKPQQQQPKNRKMEIKHIENKKKERKRERKREKRKQK